MSELPLGYERIAPVTWVYLSSLLMLGLYFKFHRVWSVRNLDLILLILLAPGLLLVNYGAERHKQAAQDLARGSKVQQQRSDGDAQLEANSAGEESTPATTAPDAVGDDPNADDQYGDRTKQEDPAVLAKRNRLTRARAIERLGYVWLFAAATLLLIRMLVDALMVRRPLLEPNLTTGGLAFLGCSLFVFLMANVVTGKPTEADLQGVSQAIQLRHRQPTEEDDNRLVRHGPGYAVIHMLISFPTIVSQDEGDLPESTKVAISKLIAILSHLAVVLGIVVIGHRHFDNLQTGFGVATLYLMLPYTAMMTGRIEHVMPAALLVWAIAFYRRPMTAGVFIGLACGTVYYPLFLLPLWITFYWQRGLLRFLIGVLSMLVLLALSLVFVSEDLQAFLLNLQKMFGLWRPKMEGLEGIWGLGWDPVFRLSVLAAFVALSGSFVIWPAQKNLGTLLSCSAAVMIATQFWHGFGGGLYIAWYLPLTLLTIFRPNLEDRIAISVLTDGWFSRRRENRSQKNTLAA